MAAGVASSADQNLILIKALWVFCCPRYFWKKLDRFAADIVPKLAGGEAPSRSAHPATLLGNLLIAIEACDLLPASLGEGFRMEQSGGKAGTGKGVTSCSVLATKI